MRITVWVVSGLLALAFGLALTMIGATLTNVLNGEHALMALTIVLGAVAAFVPWARFGTCAIAPRDAGTVVTR